MRNKMVANLSRRQAVKAMISTALITKVTGIGIGRAMADKYPTRPVTIVVPYAAGGTTDIGGRLLAKQLETHFGGTFIVENKPGASARFGAGFVVKSAPDGYTLIWTVADPFSIIPHIFRKLPYDALKDVTPIAMVGSTPMSVVVSSKVPAKDLQEFIKLAKERPDEFTYGSWGLGSGAHIRTEAFKSAAGIKLRHIPFQGSGPAFTALLGGHIDSMIVGTGLAAASHRSGVVKMLAVDTPERIKGIPDVPTFTELGIPLNLTFWNGVLGPANLTPQIVAALNGAINKIVQTAEFKRAADAIGLTVNAPGTNGTGMSAADVRKYYEAEYHRWGKVIREANIVIE